MPPELRPATAADQPFLEHLFFEAHRDEFAPLNLPDAQLIPLLQMQAKAQRQGYARDFPQAQDQIILDAHQQPIGRLLVARSAQAIQLVDIALTAASRTRGIGTTLIQALIAESQAQRIPLRLNVRPDNRAFHLYTRLGFAVTGAGASLELEFSPAGMTTPKSPVQEVPNEWDAHIGRSFLVATEPPVTLVLQRIEKVPGLGAKSFSLFFHGPAAMRLEQGSYPFPPLDQEHAEEEQHIFLVPIALLGSELEYEAVFNS